MWAIKRQVARGLIGAALVLGSVAPRAADQGPQLLVFISLSVPAPNLEQLFAQAERAQAVLVLRGLVNGSWRETGAALRPLLNRHRVTLHIDPLAFDRYEIAAVPSMVLRRPNTTPDQFVRTVGDVSLDYALAEMARTDPTFAADTHTFRQRLSPEGG